MNIAYKVKSSIKALCIYDFSSDKTMNALWNLLDSVGGDHVIENWAIFFKEIGVAGGADCFSKCVADKVLLNDNYFTRETSRGELENIPESIILAVKSDLKKLEQISKITPEDIIEAVDNTELREILCEMPKWKCGVSLLEVNWDSKINQLAEYHKHNGYGNYAKYKAFAWRDKALFPITSSNPITLNDLKNYEKQRQKVIDNTESFVMGLPANNVLLYGDRGTGKSSTVHAVLNKFAPTGLRMIEVPKSAIPEFPLILEHIMTSPMKFIIFIDDLSFSSDDDSYASLKAVLEGSISAKQKNTLIYATSNRRHLVKETFSSREGDELHRGDTIQETMSLSDRFGLAVTFVNPNKARYFDILDKIAEDRNLNVDFEKLNAGAERWALERGGRSPRVARQYIDLVESRVKRGLEWQ